MIGAISNNYSSVQWVSYGYRTRNAAPVEAVSSLPHKAADPELPVQAPEAAVPVTTRATGNVNGSLPLHAGMDPAEMAVRARVSPVEPQEEAVQTISMQDSEDAAELLPGADSDEAAGAGGIGENPGQEIREQLEAEKTERQERAEERVRQQKEAQAQREEYANELEAKEEARTERLEALRESAGAESGLEGTDAEQAAQTQGGFLQLDHTAALLRNHQMTNLLNEHLLGQSKGQDTTPITDAIDALFQNGQQRVRFGAEDDQTRQNAYQQRINSYMNNPFAAA